MVYVHEELVSADMHHTRYRQSMAWWDVMSQDEKQAWVHMAGELPGDHPHLEDT